MLPLRGGKRIFSLAHGCTVLIAVLSLTDASILKEQGKNFVNHKRAIDPYSYPVPAISFNEKPGKSNVNVQNSVSSSGYSGSGGSGSNIQGTGVPVGSVSYNAFEPDATKKLTTGGVSSTNYGGNRYQAGSSNAQTFGSSTPGQTSSVQSNLLPGFQYSSHVGGPSPAAAVPGSGAANIFGNTANNGFGGFSPKNPTITGQKQGTNFNSFNNVGSVGFGSSTNLGGQAGGGGSGSQGGMMGASYMRSSSPFYNFHVMLD